MCMFRRRMLGVYYKRGTPVQPFNYLVYHQILTAEPGDIKSLPAPHQTFLPSLQTWQCKDRISLNVNLPCRECLTMYQSRSRLLMTQIHIRDYISPRC